MTYIGGLKRNDERKTLKNISTVSRSRDIKHAARINAMDTTGEMYLVTQRLVLVKEQFETEIFKESFLRAPCSGCGSEEHSLLVEVDTLDGTPQYEYGCSIVDHYPIYLNDNRDEINAIFRLRATAYAEECNYDLDQAKERLLELEGGAEAISEGHFDAFLNDVRRLCIEHELQSIRG